jgi:hypothetical protein
MGGPSCEERAVEVPPDAAISWASYLRVGDSVCTAAVEPAARAPVVGEGARCYRITEELSRVPVREHVGA